MQAHRSLQLSRTFHPDKNQDPRATEAFQKIQHAFERLQDPLKRSVPRRPAAIEEGCCQLTGVVSDTWNKK